MTGQELHALFLKIGVPPNEPWHLWDDATPRMRQAFNGVAAELNERHDDAMFEVTAGEDI